MNFQAATFRFARSRALGSALAISMTLSTAALKAEERTAESALSPKPPTPPQTETAPRRGLVIGGAVTFGVAYLASVIGAANNAGDSARNWLYLPVAGPFLYLNNRTCTGAGTSVSPNQCLDDGVTPMVFAAFGITQAIGAILLASGFLFPKQRTVAGRRTAGQGPAEWTLFPSPVGPSGFGIGVVGTLF